MRIGHGFDVHRLEDGRPLVIGGVIVPYHKGFVAHSDGDVLIHALCDALLGAAALGDIGRHFPPEDPAYRGIDSRVLLRRVVVLLGDRALTVCSADITVAAEAPKLAPHIPAMKYNLAGDLDVDPGILNIKATTTEGLGFTGRGEGIAAWAVALLDDRR